MWSQRCRYGGIANRHAQRARRHVQYKEQRRGAGKRTSCNDVATGPQASRAVQDKGLLIEAQQWRRLHAAYSDVFSADSNL
jgi:hypothetical protein